MIRALSLAMATGCAPEHDGGAADGGGSGQQQGGQQGGGRGDREGAAHRRGSSGGGVSADYIRYRGPGVLNSRAGGVEPPENVVPPAV